MRTTAVAAAGLALLATTSPSAALAADTVRIECGAVLSRDAYLAEDLTCPGNGITVTAGITLDLRGYTLQGDGTGAAIYVDGTGLDLVKQPIRVRVEDGVVRDWADGIWFQGHGPATSGVTVDEVELTHLRNAGLRNNGGHLEVRRSTVSEAGIGISTYSGEARLDRVDVTAASLAVEHRWGGRTSVRNSTFLLNMRAFEVTSAGLNLDDVRIERGGAALVGESADVRVVHSKVTNNLVGFTNSGSSYFEDNDFSGNRAAIEFHAFGPGAVSVARGNTFKNNDIAYTAVPSYHPELSTPTLLVDNEFSRNGDAVLADAGTQIGRNTVVKSTRIGIHAPGALDLGGNVAFRNAVSPQCVGVACTIPR